MQASQPGMKGPATAIQQFSGFTAKEKNEHMFT